MHWIWSWECFLDSNYLFPELLQLVQVHLQSPRPGCSIHLGYLEYQCSVGSLQVLGLVPGEIMGELQVEGDQLFQPNLIEEGLQAILRLVVVQSLELSLQLSDNSRDHLLLEWASLSEDCL